MRSLKILTLQKMFLGEQRKEDEIERTSSKYEKD
jgi:hypothetical protein